MRLPAYNNRGFSLLEMLVVVTISMGVIGAIVVNYNSFNEGQKIRQAALTLKSNFRLAQSRAITGLKPSAGCTSLRGYTVTFNQNGYSIQASCTEGLVGSTVDVVLPNSVTFSPVPSPLSFAVLNGTASSATTITLSGVNNTFELQVSSSGDVNDTGIE